MNMTIRYGDDKSQIADLYIPTVEAIGTVCLFHGGFWKTPYDYSQFNEISQVLSTLGYCVWNIEYRRSGEKGRKWSDTFKDAMAAVNHLKTLQNEFSSINFDNMIVVGHSAGGHLSAWLSSQELNISIKKFIGLAPILDLKLAYEENAGVDAVFKLMEGTPSDYPKRYRNSSPIELINKSKSQVIIHGKNDDYVPIEWSRAYINHARNLGKEFEYVELEDCGHMDFIDSKSNAFNELLKWIRE